MGANYGWFYEHFLTALSCLSKVLKLVAYWQLRFCKKRCTVQDYGAAWC